MRIGDDKLLLRDAVQSLLLQREVSPKVNAIGSIVFLISMALVILAQLAVVLRRPGRRAAGFLTVAR